MNDPATEKKRSFRAELAALLNRHPWRYFFYSFFGVLGFIHLINEVISYFSPSLPPIRFGWEINLAFLSSAIPVITGKLDSIYERQCRTKFTLKKKLSTGQADAIFRNN